MTTADSGLTLIDTKTLALHAGVDTDASGVVENTIV
jgi:hypothetical protein